MLRDYTASRPMRVFFSFWWKCARIAVAGSTTFANNWQWLFGIPAVTGLLNYAAIRSGKSTLSTGSPILDGVLSASGAFVLTWLVAFFVRLFNGPALIDDEQKTEIARLQALVGEGRLASFDIRIEEIHPLDPDRKRFGHSEENLFRVAITNIQKDKSSEVFVALEDMPAELGISPAGHLPVMGKDSETSTFHIAASETAYVLLLKCHLEKNGLFSGDLPFSPWVSFATARSEKGSFLAYAGDWEREAQKIGELQKGHVYTGTVAVHGVGAVSCRLPFVVTVSEDQTLIVTS